MCCHPAITLSCLCVRNEATTGGQFTKLDRPTGLLFYFSACMTLKLHGWIWKTIGHLLYAMSSFVNYFKAISEFKRSYSPEMLNSGKNWQFFFLCDLEIRRTTLKDNRTPFLCYFKLCASLPHSHQSIQTGVTARKHPIRVKIGNFWFCVTLKFDIWPCKTIGHLFYATWSFVHHFTTIGELKFELIVRKRSIWIKIGNFWARVTLKFDAWPWNTIGHLFDANSSFVHQFTTIELQSGNAKFGSKSAPCDLEIWWMT